MDPQPDPLRRRPPDHPALTGHWLTRPRSGRWVELAAPAAVLAVTVTLLVELSSSLGQPFFTDEGWRGFFVSGGHSFFGELRHASAPMALGWMLVARASIALFGNTETVLRAGTFFALIPLGLVTYLLARRVMPAVASGVTSAALVANTCVLVYSTEFKSYVGEAAATSLILLLWLAATRIRRLATAVTLALIAGLLAVYSLPALFVIAPLAAAEGLPPIWRSIRVRATAGLRRPLLIAAVLALPGVLHAATFVRLQAGVSGQLTSYWSVLYLPSGVGAKLRFGWDQTAGWFTGLIANGMPEPRDKYMPFVAHTGIGSQLTVTALMIGLVASLFVAARNREARILWIALLGSAVITFALAWLRIWPYGWSRLNLYVVPLFYVLTGVGAAELWRRAYRGLRPPRVDLAHRVVGLVAALALLAVLAGTAAAARITVSDLSGLKRGIPIVNAAQLMRSVGLAVRRVDGPGDIAIAVIQSVQFSYYVEDYEGYPAAVMRHPAIPNDRILGLGRFRDPRIGAFVAAHQGAPLVFLFEASGVSSSAHYTDLRMIIRYGYHVISKQHWYKTGVLTVLSRSSAA